jgi:hypothetical protein
MLRAPARNLSPGGQHLPSFQTFAPDARGHGRSRHVNGAAPHVRYFHSVSSFMLTLVPTDAVRSKSSSRVPPLFSYGAPLSEIPFDRVRELDGAGGIAVGEQLLLEPIRQVSSVGYALTSARKASIAVVIRRRPS